MYTEIKDINPWDLEIACTVYLELLYSDIEITQFAQFCTVFNELITHFLVPLKVLTKVFIELLVNQITLDLNINLILCWIDNRLMNY